MNTFLKSIGTLALVSAALQMYTGCNKKDQNSDPQALRGRIVYAANCISCHNPDPARDGALGPAIQGSSLELLQARVLRGEYPIGYQPKRSTKIMQKLPLTEANIQELHAFLKVPTAKPQAQ
jgi:mono/diheme cytochrome c family protein